MQLGLQLVNSANLKKRFLATVAVWPNGEGIGFRSRGLQVRVLSRSIFLQEIFVMALSVFLVLDNLYICGMAEEWIILESTKQSREIGSMSNDHRP